MFWSFYNAHMCILMETINKFKLNSFNVSKFQYFPVRELVSDCQCPTQFPMIRVAEGKYRIGDTQVLIFVRVRYTSPHFCQAKIYIHLWLVHCSTCKRNSTSTIWFCPCFVHVLERLKHWQNDSASKENSNLFQNQLIHVLNRHKTIQKCVLLFSYLIKFK